MLESSFDCSDLFDASSSSFSYNGTSTSCSDISYNLTKTSFNNSIRSNFRHYSGECDSSSATSSSIDVENDPDITHLEDDDEYRDNAIGLAEVTSTQMAPKRQRLSLPLQPSLDNMPEKRPERRVVKQVTEKRRRERINSSLDRLRETLLTCMNKDPEKYGKLEKADLLDMAVSFLKIQNKTEAKKQKDFDNFAVPAHLMRASYATGFAECARQVAQCMAEFNAPTPLRSGLSEHLAKVAHRLLDEKKSPSWEETDKDMPTAKSLNPVSDSPSSHVFPLRSQPCHSYTYPTTRRSDDIIHFLQDPHNPSMKSAHQQPNINIFNKHHRLRHSLVDHVTSIGQYISDDVTLSRLTDEVTHGSRNTGFESEYTKEFQSSIHIWKPYE